MPRECTVCRHADRDAIDAELVAKASLRNIAKRFTLSVAALHRHARDHLPASLIAVAAERREKGARSVLDRIEDLEDRARSLLDAAEEAGNVHQALGALRELRSILELLAKISGELRDGPQLVVNLLASADWQRVRGMLLEALSNHPEARLAVASRLLELEAPADG